MIRFFLYMALMVELVACTGNKPYSPQVVSCDLSFADTLLSPVPVQDVDTASYTKKVNILYNGNSVVVDTLYEGVDVELVGSSLLVRSTIPGVEYRVSGSCGDGSLTIVSDFSPLVTLCGLELRAVGRDALQLSSRETVVVNVEGDNGLGAIDNGDNKDKLAAVVKLMGKSQFVGTGSLLVESTRRLGVLSTAEMFVCGADISVKNMAGTALRIGKSAYISSGSVKLASLKDVIKGKDAVLVVNGGVLDISAVSEKADAVQVGTFCMTGGKMNIGLSGAAADGIKATWICMSGGESAITVNGDALFSDKKLDYSSASCLKADSCVYISGGTHLFSSNGTGAKGVSCDGNTVISGGNLKVVTRGVEAAHPVDVNAHASSKGIKSDGSLVINGGDVEVLVLGKGERNEGVEAKKDLAINGGKVYIYAYDDAINCARSLVMNGGMLYVYSVANDAIDSNSSIEINGGILIADGSFSPEQGIDVDDSSMFVLRGGMVMSVGGGMGPMTSLPLSENSCASAVAWSNAPLKRGAYLNLEDGDGKALVSYALTRDITNSAVLISAPFVKQGKEYRFSISDSINGGEYVGNGLYCNSNVIGRGNEVLFSVEEDVAQVDDEGKVKQHTFGSAMGGFGFPPFGKFPPEGMEGMPPPPPGGSSKDGMFPPPGMKPGDGGFPGMPPSRDIKDSYSEENLPNYDTHR